VHLTMLKAKLHRATVTDCNLDYEGSISVDTDLLRRARIVPYEQVDIYNMNNGERLTTWRNARAGIPSVSEAAHVSR
jgi:aspartate 1-decarboxylase